jgi:hypothetical protein
MTFLFKKKDKDSNEINKSSQSIGKPTTQQWVPIDDVVDNTIRRKDGYYVGAVKIQPLNINLYPLEEQHRIIKQLSEVLSGIDYNYVFYSIDRPVDLDGYIQELEIKKTEEKDLIKKRILEEDLRFAAAMASEGDALDRYFYILHSIKKDTNSDKQIAYKRSLEFASELNSIGLYSHACSDHELRELLFIYFNPSHATFEKTPDGGPILPPLF